MERAKIKIIIIMLVFFCVSFLLLTIEKKIISKCLNTCGRLPDTLECEVKYPEVECFLGTCELTNPEVTCDMEEIKSHQVCVEGCINILLETHIYTRLFLIFLAFALILICIRK